MKQRKALGFYLHVLVDGETQMGVLALGEAVTRHVRNGTQTDTHLDTNYSTRRDSCLETDVKKRGQKINTSADPVWLGLSINMKAQ